MTPPLTLLESIDLLGRYRYVELAAFAAIGGRATSAEAPAVQRYLAGASLAHGWRARVVEERLPVSVGLPGTEACTRSPSPSVDRAIALAAEPGPDSSILDCLARGLYPAMAAAYRERIAAASPAPDGPVVRALGRIVADLEAVIAAGLVLLGSEASNGAADRIVTLVTDAGGPFGPLVDRR
jgi:hypothetical protein